MRMENYTQCATQCATQWESQNHMEKANRNEICTEFNKACNSKKVLKSLIRLLHPHKSSLFAYTNHFYVNDVPKLIYGEIINGCNCIL